MFRSFFTIATLVGISKGLCSGQEVCQSCPPHWTQWEKNCYRFFNQPRLNFDDSEAVCRQLTPPMGSACTCPHKTVHLVSVESEAENNFLHDWWKSMREPSKERQYARIGYTDRTAEGTWKWVNGSPAKYTNWDTLGGYPRQPDNHGGHQNCAVMWKLEETSEGDRGKWDDEQCERARAFICKFNL